MPATQENDEKFEARRAELEAAAQAAVEAAQARGAAIEALGVSKSPRLLEKRASCLAL